MTALKATLSDVPNNDALLVIEIMPKGAGCPLIELYPGNNLFAQRIHVDGQAIAADAGDDQRTTADPVSATAAVTLDGSRSGPTNQIVSYVWRENGNTLGYGPVVAGGVFSVGEHTVTLTITDKLGQEYSDSARVSILPSPPQPPYDIGDSRSTTAVTSSDPNEKIGPGGYGAAGFIRAGQLMPYRRL